MPIPGAALAAALLAGAALSLAVAPAAAGDPTSPRSLRPPGTPMRLVLLPVRLHGQHAPSAARVRRLLRGTTALMRSASFGRIAVTGVVAPPVDAGRYETAPRFLTPAVFQYAIDRAVARGVRFDGAVPVFIAASRTPTTSYGSPERVLIQGSTWSDPAALVHELGHALGLDHAVSPTVCRRPFRPLPCAARPLNLFEYGDDFDLMGYGGDRFGAYSQAALGLAIVTDAPRGRERTTLSPSDRPASTLLRLRTAGRDYFVESRAGATIRYAHAVRAPAGVEISRVAPIYRLATDDALFPRPLRLPATNPAVVCSADRACLAREVFAPGRALTVPGAFRLRVLRGRGGGRARVETTWLDRTPPTISSLGASIVRPVVGGAELVLHVRASASGAGILRVEVDQGGAPVRVAADDAPGLAVRGRGTVSVPLVAGATGVRVTLVDAAGNRSAPAAADLTTAPAALAAVFAFGPAAGANRALATPLPRGRPITVSGATDPALAGLAGDLSVIGGEDAIEKMPVEIGAGGAFSTTWAPQAPGLYHVEVTVPVGVDPSGVRIRTQTGGGWFRV